MSTRLSGTRFCSVVVVAMAGSVALASTWCRTAVRCASVTVLVHGGQRGAGFNGLRLPILTVEDIAGSDISAVTIWRADVFSCTATLADIPVNAVEASTM